MFYACVQRFDVTKNLKKICKILETKQAPGGSDTFARCSPQLSLETMRGVAALLSVLGQFMMRV